MSVPLFLDHCLIWLIFRKVVAMSAAHLLVDHGDRIEAGPNRTEPEVVINLKTVLLSMTCNAFPKINLELFCRCVWLSRLMGLLVLAGVRSGGWREYFCYLSSWAMNLSRSEIGTGRASAHIPRGRVNFDRAVSCRSFHQFRYQLRLT